VRVNMRGILGRTRINLSRLLELTPGEVLLLDRDESAPLPIVVQGRDKMFGSPTVVGGALAMKIEQPLTPIADSPTSR